MEVARIDLGMIEYGKALEIQRRLVARRQADEIGDVLLLLEHPDVITLGRRGKESNILVSREVLTEKGVSVFEVERGGDVTYHGPGQLVGYPIMDLNLRGRDIRGFVLGLEEVILRLLAKDFGIPASREEGKFTGVWVGAEKIAAIGIAIRRCVTMHGFAFNVNTDLEKFGWIIPCGIAGRGVTSLRKLRGDAVDMESVRESLVRSFEEVFDVRLRPMGIETLLE